MNKWYFCLFMLLVLTTVCTAEEGLPLRQFGVWLDFNNDSLISGEGFWKGDDEGYTFGEGLILSWLWEDIRDPNSSVTKLTIVLDASLSTRFEGTKTEEGERNQFPRERDLFLFNVQNGRSWYWRYLLGGRYWNYGEEGLAISPQDDFHRRSSSQNVNNLDIGRSNEWDILGGLGTGGEISFLADQLLIRGDVGFLTDFGEPKNFEVTTRGEILLGTSKVTEDDVSALMCSFTLEGAWIAETNDVQLTAIIGFTWNIQVCENWYLSAKPYARIPIVYNHDDFYDPNPEMILGVSVGWRWVNQ